MEENKKYELNDEELDNVSGGANLDAWFASGRSGAPICMSGHAKVVMDSYFKDGSLYVDGVYHGIWWTSDRYLWGCSCIRR